MTLSFRTMILAAAAAVLLGTEARATLTIDPTFASSITSLADATEVEASIDTAIAAIDSLYSNNGTIPVLFEYDSSLDGGAETESVDLTVSYNTYLQDLTNDSRHNPTNTVLATAVASLPARNSISQTVTVTAPFANLVLGQGLDDCFNASGTFVDTCGQAYAAIVTVSGSGDAYYDSSTGYNSTATSDAEHELDEVLGGGGAGTTLTDTSSGTPTSYGPTDFYRYASGNGSNCDGTLGALSWSDSSSVVSCYSINGGASAITDAQGNPIQFNQTGGGSDYGDFAQTFADDPNIQDAYTPSEATAVYSGSSPEYTMMESIGYDGTSVPEPASMLLLGGTLPAIASLRRKRAKGLALRR